MKSLKFVYNLIKPEVEVVITESDRIELENRLNKYYERFVDEINKIHGEIVVHATGGFSGYTFWHTLNVDAELGNKIKEAGLLLSF